ncbi:MAG: RagB/SusD family nutrient uptake outer membrane protein [Rikenellaceae bacterium]
MRLNIKKYFLGLGLLSSVVAVSSCNNYLDMTPQSSLTDADYFSTEADLAAYTIARYSFSGPYAYDYHTGPGPYAEYGSDNMVSSAVNPQGLWKDNVYTTPATGGWTFTTIRNANYFFEMVETRLAEGKLTPSTTVDHYLGEMYFIRAQQNYNKLVSFGDNPIITEVLPDDMEILVQAEKRYPRNEFVRFILSDLDKAIDLLFDNFYDKNRITKNVALLFKSRVALFEASWERYHAGTPYVPGGPGWPGEGKGYCYYPEYSIPNGTTTLEKEVDFFLGEAIEAAEQVASNVALTPNSGVIEPSNGVANGWNDYFEMFAVDDPSVYPEVLMWKDYSADYSLYHTATSYIRAGGGCGFTKDAVETYLTKGGFPIYSAQGQAEYQGDLSIDDVKKNRDERLQLFMFGNSSPYWTYSAADLAAGSAVTYFNAPDLFDTNTKIKDVTGYRNRKTYSYNINDHGGIFKESANSKSYAGFVIFRAAEAYLNYMEAYYMKNSSLDANCYTYWNALRTRAGITGSIDETIAATDMAQEVDWAKYSAKSVIDATLYNIRRERRIELMAEGLRWHDLKRWRALDQINDNNKYIPEGCNFWGGDLWENEEYTNANVNYASVSPKEESDYIRPYRIVSTHTLYDGYSWQVPRYLTAVPADEILITTTNNEDGTTNWDSAVLYQNPYYSIYGGGDYEMTWK